MNFFTGITVRGFDRNLFTTKYLSDCMGCSHCQDICCSYGCPVDLLEMENILSYASQLEPFLGIPVSAWFEEVTVNTDYPSGKVSYTKVFNSRCVFFRPGYRGCTLHRFCIEEGIDVHSLKPMVCNLFPVTWENGQIMASDFLKELPCQYTGISVFEAQKEELRVYLGDSFVTELERSQYK